MRRAHEARRVAGRLLRPLVPGLAAAALLACTPAPAETDPWAKARTVMTSKIERYGLELPDTAGVERFSPEVLDALNTVPRHLFVPPAQREWAYEDRPLRIGHGQTISQPLIVALMTELAKVGPDARVLEIGTGSGFQAAVLSLLAAEVYSIEIIPELGESAAKRLAELGYANVQVRVGDGYLGWPEAAPFDAILVTAAADRVPQPLIDQLKPGGRMVIPVGAQDDVQFLTLVEKTATGKVVMREGLAVRFVPLTRDLE